jgi:hypothetical protein
MDGYILHPPAQESATAQEMTIKKIETTVDKLN